MNKYDRIELAHPNYKYISAYSYEPDVLFAKLDHEMLNHTLGTTSETDLLISIISPEQYMGVWVYNGEMIHSTEPYGSSNLIFRRMQEKPREEVMRYLPITHEI
ncbi:UNVERIFIED_ORG: hypothetical protein FHU00_0401 [Citrobacter freundii]